MKLRCRINGKDYDLIQGVTFSEEYNETLDSGTIKISHVPLINMKPYDDVFIWQIDDNLVFDGYKDDEIYFKKIDPINNIELDYLTFNYNKESLEFERNVLIDGETSIVENIFYKHLLISNFSEKMLNLKDLNLSEEEYKKNNTEKGVGEYIPVYEYIIQLFSETKYLESIKLPNISVTQPLKYTQKVSSWELLNRYVDLYNPLVKKVSNEEIDEWVFEKKFSISNSLKEIFENVYSPDFTLNNPSLKEIIAKIMITKDLIPYVKNDVIYGMDITERKNSFNKDLNCINYISGSMSSNDYCDNLKKNYSDALSQDSLSHLVEYMGFRNSDVALMTLENMRIETRFPIYKINKMYMCYYKKMAYLDRDSGKTEDGYFLCKQDITPFVKLNTERNVLSQDWSKLDINSSIEEATKYRMMTIGYDIGSKYITGWGEKYTYPANKGDGDNLATLINGFWDVTKTYIQNIFNFLEQKSQFGIYSYDYVRKSLSPNNYNRISVLASGSYEALKEIICPQYSINLAQKQKGLFFQVDYQAFYSGSIIHTKDNGRDNITIIDNPSSSLTLLEQDGIFTKEKANRFGNKGLTINARYNDISQLQPLGSVYEDYNNTDVIIYHREYQIWDSYVKATYYGMHDYVLKNFYTSVYARHRTWNLMSYGESVRRAENRKIMLLLSKDDFYYEDFENSIIQEKKFNFYNFENRNNTNLLYPGNNNEITHIISAFYKTRDPKSINDFKDENGLNYAYLTYDTKDSQGNNLTEKYAVDVNSFVSGNSLCVNLSMPDNISAGTWIEKPVPQDYGKSSWKFQGSIGDDNTISLPIDSLIDFSNIVKVVQDYKGSVQKWYSIADKNTGYTKTMGLFVGHIDSLPEIENVNIPDDKFDAEDNAVGQIYSKYLLQLPRLTEYVKDYNIEVKNEIGNVYNIYKDNKEVIDMTYQIEPITKDKSVMISPWFMKLSDLVSKYRKFDDSFPFYEDNSLDYSGQFGEIYATILHEESYMNASPSILMKIKKSDFSLLKFYVSRIDGIKPKEGKSDVFSLKCTYDVGGTTGSGSSLNRDVYINYYSLSVKQIKSISDNSIEIIADETLKGRYAYQSKGTYSGDSSTTNQSKKLEKMEDLEGMALPDTDQYYWFILRNNKSFIPNFLPPSGYSTFWFAGVENSQKYFFDLSNNNYSSFPTSSLKTLEQNFAIDVTVLSKEPPKSELYLKNMILVGSNNYLKKENVHNQYGYVNDFNYYQTYDNGEYCLYEGQLYMYKEETPSWGNFDETKWDIIEDTYIYQNHFFKVGEGEKYWSNIDLNILPNKVSETFEISQNKNMPCIKVNLEHFGYEKGSKNPPFTSLSYYYLNEYCINFVFGINLNIEDWENGYTYVYISMLSTRDTRVYDRKNNLAGEIVNYATKTSPTFENKQKYIIKHKEQ